MIVYEGGEPMRFNPEAIAAGVAGVQRVLHVLEMVEDFVPPPSRVPTFEADGSKWVRASRSGIFRQVVALGEKVTKGKVLGRIGGPFPGGSREVRSTIEGMVIGHTNKPLVHQGDALVHIGTGINRTS